jgi:hypothetical protein
MILRMVAHVVDNRVIDLNGRLTETIAFETSRADPDVRDEALLIDLLNGLGFREDRPHLELLLHETRS